MPDIRRLRGTGACGYDLAANPTLLLQQTEARRHKDGEKLYTRYFPDDFCFCDINLKQP